MLDDSPHSAQMFGAGLRRIVAGTANGSNPLAGISLPSILLDAWAAARAARDPAAARDPFAVRPTNRGPAGAGRSTNRGPAGRDAAPRDAAPPDAAAPDQPQPARPAVATGSYTNLPAPSMVAARTAAGLIDLAIRPLTAGLPTVDLCHVVNGGLSTMVALAAKWRNNTPFVVTEHSGYTADPLLRKARTDPAVYAIALRFLRALARLGYTEAAAVVAPSERMRRWALDNGAPKPAVTMIPPGVDQRDHPPLRQEPAEPVVAWVGPERERGLVLTAFQSVRDQVPDARLIVIGHPPEGTRPLGASFTGPVANRRALYGMAQVIAISGYDAGMPYPLIEAMMCGRPTVCTESGGLAEMVGIGAMVVPANDPAALARACAALLTDERLRREIANSARQRSRTLFSLGAMLDGYQRVYAQATAAPAAAPLALPAQPGPGLAVGAGV
jgi:glycosyltransferase involved in cell wall biosynthesis